jgi:hypothetical protein
MLSFEAISGLRTGFRQGSGYVALHDEAALLGDRCVRPGTRVCFRKVNQCPPCFLSHREQSNRVRLLQLYALNRMET